MKNLFRAIKASFLFLFIFSLLVINNFASASVPQPGCSVNVYGTIKSVELREAWVNPCVKECGGGDCCPTDAPLSANERYSIIIKVDKVFSYTTSENGDTCKGYFTSNRESLVRIDKNKVNPGDVFQPNQKIQIEYFVGGFPYGGGVVSYKIITSPFYNIYILYGTYIVAIAIIALLVAVAFFLKKKLAK